MNRWERMSTEELWAAIEDNARYARKHLDWIDYLDNIKIACALIAGRIERFQHERKAERLLGDRRLTKKSRASGEREVKK